MFSGYSPADEHGTPLQHLVVQSLEKKGLPRVKEVSFAELLKVSSLALLSARLLFSYSLNSLQLLHASEATGRPYGLSKGHNIYTARRNFKSGSPASTCDRILKGRVFVLLFAFVWFFLALICLFFVGGVWVGSQLLCSAGALWRRSRTA